MKKIWALILAAALMLSLAACGGESDAMNEMLENATEIDFNDLPNQEAQAALEVGNIYIVSNTVSEISAEYCELNTLTRHAPNSIYTKTHYTQESSSPILRVYLPTETLANLSFADDITVVGEITNVAIEEEEEIYFGFPSKIICYEMENAYIIDDVEGNATEE